MWLREISYVQWPINGVFGGDNPYETEWIHEWYYPVTFNEIFVVSIGILIYDVGHLTIPEIDSYHIKFGWDSAVSYFKPIAQRSFIMLGI